MPAAVPALSGAEETIVTMESELWVRRGAPPTMAQPHRHDDLEVNLVLDGRLEYLIGGSRVTVSAGQIALFWAATPHRLIGENAHEAGDVCWVHIPLTTVLGWRLPERDLSELLTATPVVVGVESVSRDVDAMFDSWQRELVDTETAEIALLEAQAFVRRVLKRQVQRDDEGEHRHPVSNSSDGMRSVTAMAQFAVNRFREPISASDIANAVHLNPNYAMTLFRSTVGMTLGTYLTRCRVAEAQRLLITSTMTTVEIAHAAGFGSQSSFYEHFTRTCGRSPGAYRRSLR